MSFYERGLTEQSAFLDHSLEHRAEDQIEKHPSRLKACRRRACWFGKTFGVCMCVFGLPVCIIVLLLYDGTDGAPGALRNVAQDVGTIRVMSDGIETRGGEKAPANFTCLGNVSGMISAEPAGNTADEGRALDHDLETTWISSEPDEDEDGDEHRHEHEHRREHEDDGEDDGQDRSRRLRRPQRLAIELDEPVSCVETVRVFWFNHYSAATYNISVTSTSGEVTHRQVDGLPDERDRVDSIDLGVSDLYRVELSLLAPISEDSDIFKLREVELLGFREGGRPGEQPDSGSSSGGCEKLPPLRSNSTSLVNTNTSSRTPAQEYLLEDEDYTSSPAQGIGLVNVLENCTSLGSPKYSNAALTKAALEVGLPWLSFVIIVWLIYAFRHSLKKECFKLKDRIGEQNALMRATSRASYEGSFKSIKATMEDSGLEAEISRALVVSLPIVPSKLSRAVSASTPSTRGAYGRGTKIENFETLDDFLKMRVLAWVDCTELARLCSVCKWWQRLHLQAGHWALVRFASPYWSGHEGRSKLSGFANLCCIELSSEQLGNTYVEQGDAGAAMVMVPGSNGGGAQDMRSFRHRAQELLGRKDLTSAGQAGYASSFVLSARDLQLRKNLCLFRLRSHDNDRSNRNVSWDANENGNGMAEGDVSISPRPPPAVWELSDDFVHQLYSRDCKLTAVDLSASDFNGELRELKSVRTLSLRDCHELDVFTCHPSALPALQQLDLSGCRSLWDVNGIFNCWTVVEIDLSHCPSLQNISPLAACSRLQKLNLSHCEQLRETSVLAALSMLQHLDLSCSTNVDDISHLSKCANLLSCDVSWTSVTDVVPLVDCRKLQEVCAMGCLLSDGVAELQQPADDGRVVVLRR